MFAATNSLSSTLNLWAFVTHQPNLRIKHHRTRLTQYGLSRNRGEAYHVRFSSKLFPEQLRCAMSSHVPTLILSNLYILPTSTNQAKHKVRGNSNPLQTFPYMSTSINKHLGGKVGYIYNFTKFQNSPNVQPQFASGHDLINYQGTASPTLESAGRILAHPCQAFAHPEAPIEAL